VADFKTDAWPAALLLPIAVLVEWTLRPTAAVPKPRWITRGLSVAVLYLAISTAWVWHLGWWEGAPR
jgi:hypothetical protein